jgi:uncharacterized PurR-regulated membrane protein YhhQ (DUF165 family)
MTHQLPLRLLGLFPWQLAAADCVTSKFETPKTRAVLWRSCETHMRRMGRYSRWRYGEKSAQHLVMFCFVSFLVVLYLLQNT